MQIQEQYVKELLSTGTGSEGTLLIPRKIHNVLIEESQKALIDRRYAAIYLGPTAIPGSSVDINLELENKMLVRVIAEGAEVFLDQDQYETVNMKPKKYGVAIRITRELMEDAQWPLLERNIKKAARKFAENETNLIITALDGAANTVAGGAAVTISNLTTAIQYLDDADKNADVLFVGNEVINDFRNIDTFVEADKRGDGGAALKTGVIGMVYGLEVARFSTNAAPSTTYAKYAYVIDSKEAYAIAEKRPITVENFTLPTYDMSGAACTQRIKVSLLRSSAVAKITSS